MIRRTRGAVLVLVVMLVSVLAVVVAQLALASGTSAVTASHARRDLQHTLALQSAADWLTLRLGDDAKRFAFKQGQRQSAGLFRLQLGQATVTGVVDDESAKLNLVSLYQADRAKDAQALLLRAIQRTGDPALRANLAPLTQLAQRTTIQRNAAQSQISRSPIRRLEQLILAPHPAWPSIVPRANADHYLAHTLTVVSDGRVNLLAAAPEVVDVVLAPLSRDRREAIRRQLAALADDEQADPRNRRQLGSIGTTASTCFSVHLTSRIGQHRKDVLTVLDARSRNPEIRQWCELN